MFSILGKVGVDQASVRQAFTTIKAAAVPAGREIGKQLKSSIMGAMSLGAAISMFRSSLQRSFDIRREATRLDVGKEVFQTLQILADATGASLDELATKFRASIQSGDGFAQTILAARQELKGLGRIVDEGTVDRLARAFDSLATITGRLAPGIAFVTDKIVEAYDKASQWVQYLFGKFGQFAYTLMGDKENAEIRRIMAEDAFTRDDPTTSAASALAAAKQQAIEIAREATRAATTEAKANKEREERIRLSGLDVSSDVAMGRYIGPRGISADPMRRDMKTLLQQVREINGKLASFK